VDPYQTLGVSRDASQEDIRSAYRKLAKSLHPDLNPGSRTAETRFKEVSAAYELIGDAEARRRFDQGEIRSEQQARRSGPRYYETQSEGGRYSFGGGFEGIDPDVFDAIFGGAREAPRPPPIYSLQIPFRDAVLGAQRDLTLPDGKRLRVTIPPGVDSGTRLRLGDVVVELQVLPSSEFRREGRNLHTVLRVSLAEAVLGGEAPVDTVEGSVTLRIPKGVSDGARLRLRGKGVPDRHGGQRGDLIVELRIVLPEKIDPELERAIGEWSAKHPYNPRARAAYREAG
jgi:DnaJ-class molecular chaperone